MLFILVISFARACGWTAGTCEAAIVVARSLATDGGGYQLALAVDDTTAYPDLDAHAAVCCMSLGKCIVNVGTEGMERCTALLVVLGTRHFSSANTTGDGDLDAFSAGTHGVGDGALDGAAVLDTAFNLLCDILGDDDGIEIGAFHLGDVDLDVLARDFFELFLQFVDLRACLADDKTRAGGVDSDGEELQSSFDIYLRNAGLGETSVEVLANLIVLNEFLLEFSSAIPIRVPSADDT